MAQLIEALSAGGSSEERLARLTQTLDAVEEGLQLIDTDWRYRYANLAACRRGLRTREQLIGRTMQEVYPGIEETLMFQSLREVMTSRAARTVLNEVTCADGEVGWVELHVEPHPEGIVVLSRDVTAHRRHELEAERALRFDALGRLAGGVAHDFNQLVSVVLTCTGLALEELPPESPVQDELRDALAAAMSAGSLIRQLLGFSRSRSAQLEPLELDAVVRDARPLVQQLAGASLAVSLSLPDAPLVVRASRVLLEQVLVNLVVNARDAARGEGSVLVSVRLDPARRPPCAELRVAQAGLAPGGAPTLRGDDAFSRGRTPGRGTGLGLSTVTAIVARLGGWFSVERHPGPAVGFVVTLPLVPRHDDAPGSPGATRREVSARALSAS